MSCSGQLKTDKKGPGLRLASCAPAPFLTGRLRKTAGWQVENQRVMISMGKMLLKIKSEFAMMSVNRFDRIMKMMIKFSGYLAAVTFGAEEIVDLRPEVDNVGQVTSQNDHDDDDGAIMMMMRTNDSAGQVA